MTRRQALIYSLIGLIAIVGGAGIIYSLIGNPLDPFDNRHFSPSVWRASNAEVRARMARSAVEQMTHGLEAAKVVALFGPPGEVLRGEDGGGHKLGGALTYSYYLGSWSTYGFDDAFLYVHLDHADHVIGAEINGY